MSNIRILRSALAFGVAILTAASPLAAQVNPPTGQQTLAAALNVYVFPTAGQPSTQQSEDESACYNWATQNSGVNPFAVAQQQTQQAQQSAAAAQQAQQAGQGTGAKGAVGGAAVGALIGGVAGDEAGKGAVWGAGLGLVAGRIKARKEQEAQEAQVAQQAATSTQLSTEQLTNFKKAFSVCLQAKKYMVQY